MADQSVLKGSRQYKRFVKPSIPFYETNPLSYLQQTPERALFNDEFEFNFSLLFLCLCLALFGLGFIFVDSAYSSKLNSSHKSI